MRATSMSFFKTAKSTFMSTNDLQSDNFASESFVAWGDQSATPAPGRGGPATIVDEDDGSELASNADHILAGGSMSILRRKGKQFKDKRMGRDRGANLVEAANI